MVSRIYSGGRSLCERILKKLAFSRVVTHKTMVPAGEFEGHVNSLRTLERPLPGQATTGLTSEQFEELVSALGGFPALTVGSPPCCAVEEIGHGPAGWVGIFVVCSSRNRRSISICTVTV
jgi:hypothetical protein